MPIRKHGRRWEVDVSVGGRRVRRSTHPGATRGQARELERKLYDDLHRLRTGQTPRRQIDEAIEAWLFGEAETLRSHRKLLSHAKALVPFVTGVPLEEAPTAAREAIRVMRQQGLSNATINRRIALIRRACNKAHEWGWLENPIGQRIKLLPESHPIELLLEPADIEALAEACPRQASAAAVIFLAYTGLRRGEFWRMEVREGVVRVLRSKSGKSRSIPIPERAQGIPHPIPITDTQLRIDWQIARVKAGFPTARIHDLRHAYISWLVRAGTPLRIVQELAGHSTLAMTSRYAHLAPGEATEAVQKAFGLYSAQPGKD